MVLILVKTLKQNRNNSIQGLAFRGQDFVSSVFNLVFSVQSLGSNQGLRFKQSCNLGFRSQNTYSVLLYSSLAIKDTFASLKHVLGFRVQVQVLGFRVRGLGVGLWGQFRFMVQGLGFESFVQWLMVQLFVQYWYGLDYHQIAAC